MIERLVLSQAQWESMQAHVDSCAPLEGCGLLAGTAESVYEVLPVTNREHSPIRFRMDAAEQLRAFRTIDELGLELLGIFHSHPADERSGSGQASGPSATDVEEAAYAVVHVIWSRHGGRWRAGGFWIEEGRFSSVSLRITPGE